MTRARLRVRFEPSGVTLELDAGERVLDAADEHSGALPLPIACRAGNCGACLVRVQRGAALIAPATAAEQDTLQALAAAPGERLGCQLRAIADLSATPPVADVVLEPVRR